MRGNQFPTKLGLAAFKDGKRLFCHGGSSGLASFQQPTWLQSLCSIQVAALSLDVSRDRWMCFGLGTSGWAPVVVHQWLMQHADPGLGGPGKATL
jgi:hypothetical protein